MNGTKTSAVALLMQGSIRPLHTPRMPSLGGSIPCKLARVGVPARERAALFFLDTRVNRAMFNVL